MPKSKVAALQVGTSPAGTAATLQAVLAYEDAIRTAGVQLVVLPEALLGGYPKGETFGTRLGYRLPAGRDTFAKVRISRKRSTYRDRKRRRLGRSPNAARRPIIGVIERAGSTLYCTALFFDPTDGLVAKHRKLMPTGTERLIWGQGDGSTLPVVATAAGRACAAICWENHMPLLRTAMYAKGVQIWCAPTVDERDIWQCSMRHIAHEGRCFVVSACQVQPSPRSLGVAVPDWDADRPLIRGGSVIVGPFGDVLAGPLINDTGLLVADIDTDALLVGARCDFDVVGHYARPDVFRLTVDERAKPAVEFSTDRNNEENK